MSATLPPDQQRGERVSGLWKPVNVLKRAVGELQTELRRLKDIVARIDRRKFKTERQPFEAYIIPLSNILAPTEEDGDEWWRTIRVRSGRANFVFTIGCDNYYDEGVTPEAFVVPEDCAVYYLWVDMTDPEAPELQHTTFPSDVPTHWEGFPELSTTIRPVALINTDGPGGYARIEQLQHGHIWPSGGGDGTWT